MIDTINRNLNGLLELQRLFDSTRGFSSLGVTHLDPAGTQCALFDEKIAKAQFATLGLCGEIGELANGIKKAIRGRRDMPIAIAALDRATTELPDILAYLLKLFSIFEIDPETRYLETMALNCLRFPIANATRGPHLIGIAGESPRDIDAVAEKLVATFPSEQSVIRIEDQALPCLPESGESIERLIDNAEKTIASCLETPGHVNWIILETDPAYYLQAMLPRTDVGADIAATVVTFELAVSGKIGGRHLIITPPTVAANIALAEKLATHGALRIAHMDSAEAECRAIARSLMLNR